MNKECKKLIDRLCKNSVLSSEEYLFLIENRAQCRQRLFEKASAVRRQTYGDAIYARGLIEFSNYCRNDCYYCGIRKSNSSAERYRLSEKEIFDCADYGYALGLRTFVLQSGEDAYFTDERLCAIIKGLKAKQADCAVTLSLGERSYESYKLLKEAGADRYLLRHETADSVHYAQLHPAFMQFENRISCLNNLKALGYQVGAGFMVGSPFQTAEHLSKELLFLKKLNPHMVGIGPFIPHRDTPFADKSQGSAELTLFMLALVRLTLPNVLLPATTALATADLFGYEKGILAGANVIMPNLSPPGARENYTLYNNKLCAGDDAAQNFDALRQKINAVGCRIVTDRGDYKGEQNV